MNNSHEPDERALTEAARRQLEDDYREAPDERPMGPVGNPPSGQDAQRAAEAGLSEASMPGHGPTMDDATPETLMPDDGRRSAAEARNNAPAADSDLTEVDGSDIGAGGGLDEAELGRAQPLDGKPWNGDPEQPLESRTPTDKALSAPASNEPDHPSPDS